ncbi:NAD(+) diphosphatase [Maricaulaceae bacterium EIL42A08]|nr:NAD(+) diphosphatase [Maricaulaceae bacterium EIL42A08]
MKLTFTDSPLDFAGLQRGDKDWIFDQQSSREAQAILFAGADLALDEHGEPMVVPARRTRMLPLKSPGLVFLGLEEGKPWFAGALEEGVAQAGPDFRISAMQAPPHLACIFARARSLLMWHGRRRFCSNCGGENTPSDGGTRLKCQSCEMEHFPRVDPSVIMLPWSGDKCVMGRQASWPEGLYATLAGFMEPGETIEEACARETMEEIHRPVISASYVTSQPWPFPSSLMIGLMAEIEPGELIPDDDLEDARWFTRDEVRALYEGEMGQKFPKHFSISRLLIERWLNGET